LNVSATNIMSKCRIASIELDDAMILGRVANPDGSNFRKGQVDLAYDEQNIKRVVTLARDADQLFIEAPFLDVDANIVAERQHLTAHQAGHIAKQARVGRLIPFHFSARYRDRAEELTREAQEAFSVSESPELPD
jgi:ribonuclease BN (tRNA processing enzyme)